LTRRANHRHNDIIAKIVKPAPETAAGFLFPKSPNRTAARTSGRHTSPHASSLARRRPNHYHPRVISMRASYARARERAGTRRGVDAATAAAPCA